MTHLIAPQARLTLLQESLPKVSHTLAGMLWGKGPVGDTPVEIIDLVFRRTCAVLSYVFLSLGTIGLLPIADALSHLISTRSHKQEINKLEKHIKVDLRDNFSFANYRASEIIREMKEGKPALGNLQKHKDYLEGVKGAAWALFPCDVETLNKSISQVDEAIKECSMKVITDSRRLNESHNTEFI